MTALRRLLGHPWLLPLTALLLRARTVRPSAAFALGEVQIVAYAPDPSNLEAHRRTIAVNALEHRWTLVPGAGSPIRARPPSTRCARRA